MADKTISDRLKSLFVLEGLVETNSGEAAEKLAELLRPVLADGEALPDLAHVHDLLVRLLRLRWTELDGAGAELEDKKWEERESSGARDAAGKAVHDKLLDLKRVMSGIFRDKADEFVRFAGEVPRNNLNLVREAEYTLDRLQRMQEEEDLDITFQPTKWIGPLERLYADLVAADDEARLAAKAVESLQAARRQALEEFGRSFVCIGGELKERYRLLGMEEAARAAQPSAKYPGRTMAEVRQLGKAPRKKGRSRRKKS